MTRKLLCLGTALGGLALIGAATVAIAGPYGAIATSPTAGYGYSNNYDDANAASERALSECAARSRNCEVKGTFENTCVSIATAGNGAMGWAWGHGRSEDERLAMQTCQNNKGDNCAPVARFCTGNP